MGKSLSKILIVSFIIRLALLIIDNYWFKLPQGGIDTENFDLYALDFYMWNTKLSLLEIMSSGVKVFSYFGYIIYSIFGRSPFIWAFFMIFFGVGTVYYVYKTVFLITENHKIACSAAWIVCLFPNMAILSALVLREAPIQFFLTISIYYLVRYYELKGPFNLFRFFLFGLIASVLHSAVFSIFIGFIIGFIYFNRNVNALGKLFVIMILLVGFYFINSQGIGLSKFGGTFDSAYAMLEEGINASESRAMYPDWLLIKGGFSDLWKIPIRMIAFLFAPLIPFMVKITNHLFGVMDAIFYFVLIFLSLRKKIFLKHRYVGIIFSIILVFVLAFSFGSSNFGTNIRHRAKIFPLLTITGIVALNYNKHENI